MVTKVNELIKKDNFYDLAYQNLEEYKELASNSYELNTYAKILESTGRKNKALEVLKLNIDLFKGQPATHMSLADFLVRSGQKNEALASYKKAYEMNPENEKLKNKIAQLKSELNGSHN